MASAAEMVAPSEVDELGAPAGRLDQPADGAVGALELLVRGVGPMLVRGVVVVGEVEDEAVEPVAGYEPATDRSGVAVHRSSRAPADGERGAGRIGLEQVV